MDEPLDKIYVKSPFDVRAAISAVEFYWNLARHKNEQIVVEIHQQPREVYCEMNPRLDSR